MHVIKNMRLSTKLISSFMIIAIISIIIGIVGITGMNSLSGANEKMYLYNAKSMGDIAVMYDLLATQRICASNMVIFYETDRDFSLEEEKSLAEKEKAFDEVFNDYKNWLSNSEETALYNDIKKLYYNDFAACKQGVRDAVAAGDSVAMVAAIEKMDSSGSDVSDILDQTNALNDELGSDSVEANKGQSRERTIMLFVVMIIGVALSLLLTFATSTFATKPLKVLSSAIQVFTSTGSIELSTDLSTHISEIAQQKDELGAVARDYGAMMTRFSYLSTELDKIADGDLSSDIKLSSVNDVMGKSLQMMIAKFNAMFEEINASTEQVSTGAKQIADGAQSLAQGTTEQASSIDELSSSISEIAEKTKANAKMAEKAAELADTIKINAEKGSSQMDEMILAVNEINQASRSISKVIKVIDDIAFQTNILALNAAVEAARAGQHGKGFAVVAEEVRNLASKSAEAAKDTGVMIQDSMEKAGLGAKIADETATSLAEIVSGIKESNMIVNDIAKSSEEQFVGIEQINIGIDQVSQVVQHNSATAEQSAAASEEMSGQSDMLQQLITQFKLKNGSSLNKRFPKTANYNKKPLSLPMKIGLSHSSNSVNSNIGFGKY